MRSDAVDGVEEAGQGDPFVGFFSRCSNMLACLAAFNSSDLVCSVAALFVRSFVAMTIRVVLVLYALQTCTVDILVQVRERLEVLLQRFDLFLCFRLCLP